MNLADWQKNGWLESHQSTRQEIRDLMELVERDLGDSALKGLSADWRFAIAYNAALQAATAALAAAGYRATREAHHYRVIQSLLYTIKADDDFVQRLDTCRKKRNISSYETSGAISDMEAAEMMKMAEELRQAVRIWLKKYHPDLA